MNERDKIIKLIQNRVAAIVGLCDLQDMHDEDVEYGENTQKLIEELLDDAIVLMTELRKFSDYSPSI